MELGNYGIEGEVKALKRDKDLLIKELVVTRQNEEKLKTKCDTLENRVSNLENSSKQMQNFIMHYFSQVLQPVSQAMASRKRKRLPPSSAPDTMDVAVDQPRVAHVSHPAPSPSVDALRMMMQKMGVGMPTTPAPPHPTQPKAISNGPNDGPTFAPATILELPHEDLLNASNSLSNTLFPRTNVPLIGPPLPDPSVVGSNFSAASNTLMRTNTPPLHLSVPRPVAPPPRAQSSPTTVSLPLTSTPRKSPKKQPPVKTIPAVSPTTAHIRLGEPPTTSMDLGDAGLEFLEDISSPPNSTMTMDLIESTISASGDQENGDDNLYNTQPGHSKDYHADFDITFNGDDAHCVGSKEEERAIEDFLELSGDEQPLPPPLTHLPEGTDINALAKQIEGFAEDVDL